MHQSTGGEAYDTDATQEINSLLEKVTQTYDGFNRLKKAINIRSGDRVTVDYVYNGDGLRTKKRVQSTKAGNFIKETNYDYDRQHVILETDSTDKVSTRYIRGINYIARMDEANQYAYYLYNGHGDVVQTVTSLGKVLNQYDYDAFGNPTLTIEVYTESIRYGGEFYDAETSLYYLRARYYDPYIGRFVSEDSYWGEENNPLSLNLYTYANNDPIQFLDPTGHWAKGDEKLKNIEAQAKIIALTNAYYKASTPVERAAIAAQATAVRDAPDSNKAVVTPLQFQSKEITKIVAQGVSSRGFATKEEWDQALIKAGIQAPPPSNGHTDKMEPGQITETDKNRYTTVIGRTNIVVTTDYSLTINNKTQKGTESAKASLQMNYNVTADEYMFLSSVGIPTLEQALYVLDAVKANKGKVTAGIMKDAGLKGGAVDEVEMVYNLSLKGLSLADAQEMYRQEVINPSMQQAFGLAAMGLLNGTFSLSKKSSTPSTVTRVKEPVKQKPASNAKVIETEKKLAEGKGNVVDSSPIKIPSNAVKIEQAKNGYDQIKYTWSDGTYKYEARWHTRTPGAPADQGNTWVVTRTTPGSQTTRRTQDIMTGENQWTSMKQWQDAVSARQNGVATPEQQALLDSGHWNAP